MILSSILALLKVTPLKLFYYQTFLKLGIINIHDMNIKQNAIKRWGHRASLRVGRLLNWGIFTGCALKIGIPFLARVKSSLIETQNFILNIKLLLFK